MKPFLTVGLVMLAAAACSDTAGPQHARPSGPLTLDLAAAPAVAIVDALGSADPTTRFSVFGSGGTTVFSSGFPGPALVLTQPTTITEIGAFLNNCKAIVAGVPQCPGTLPFTVQIRGSQNGVPDANTILASFTLSHDDDPLVVSYESVATNLTLGPGTYFVLFAPQNGDEGFVLGSASDPFSYRADLIPTGFLDPLTGEALIQNLFMAVRIVGSPVTPQAAIQLLMDDVRTLVSAGALTQDQGNGLLDKLAAATARLDDGTAVAACNQLGAFVKQVGGFVQAGKLTPAEGQALIAAVAGIRAQVGCAQT